MYQVPCNIHYLKTILPVELFILGRISMKPASNKLHNKDMINPCRFHTAKLLNKR